MAEYRHTVLAEDYTPSADETKDWDLPVNPLSFIALTVKCLNAGTNTKATLAQILSAIENIEVLRFGSAQVSLSGADLYALNCVLLGKEPWQENVINTDNAVRHLTMVIPFGRKLYDPTECLPATIRGELTLRIQMDIADTGYDGLMLQIETIELLGANPQRHLKYTTITHTPSATGDSDIELPIGNPYLGLLLYSTTIPTGTSWTTTINKATILAANVEKYVREVAWETLHGMLMNRLSPANAWAEKFHMENLAATYTQNADTATEEQDDSDIANYAYIDFDPLGDGQFLFETAGLSDLKLRIDAGDTNAVRVVPIELKSAGGR